jgi:hypothetical protein
MLTEVKVIAGVIMEAKCKNNTLYIALRGFS